MKDRPGIGDGTGKRSARRVRLAVVAPILAGVIAGTLFGLRALDLWTHRPRSEQVPTAGLLYLGSLFLCGGLLFLNRRLWRAMHSGSFLSTRDLFPDSPTGRSSPWRDAIRGFQGRIAEREERERDSPELQRRAAVTAIVAGAMIVGYALLR